MLDIETRKRIDNARDILVGKIPVPNIQVEQITLALLYKFMDDIDHQTIMLGGNPTYFSGDYEKYSFKNIMSKEVGSQTRFNLYSEALEKMYSHKDLPQTFKDIFKNATIPYKDPETLTLFLKEIEYFSYEDSEKLGDAYEYLLSVLSAQGGLGQFRTPRHIIDFIVKVVNPNKDSKILDPACGTAGFLISAYKHILEQNKNDKEQLQLDYNERIKILDNITGYDIEPSMVKIAEMNMFLHGCNNPKIHEYDTLTSDDRWDDKYDVILANPPFMTPKGGITPHKRFSVKANRSEVLFVDYIMEHLKRDGRAGIIVPEGIVFQTSNAYKDLRKQLIDSNSLYAVISLPSGVFQPYSGVKTSILLLYKTLAKQTDSILFIKVENDGYSLGANRAEVKLNDLPKVVEIISRHKEAIVNNKEFILSVEEEKIINLVKKEELQNTDYILAGDRYRKNDVTINSDYDIVKIEDIVDIYNGSTPLKSNNLYWDNGNIPWFTIEDIRIQGRVIKETRQFITEKALNETSVKLLPKNTILLCCTASVGEYAITDIELTTNQQFNGLVVKNEYKEKVNPKYLFYISDNFKEELNRLSGTTSFQFVSVKNLKQVQIPLPTIEIQNEIVSEIGKYQKIIEQNKKLIEIYESKIKEKLDKIWKK
ncbi:MAG: N-6 DNA methylase [Bacilli bacterium]|nr:N-6 DNA methylase [Bacilli bacterium]